MIRHRLVLVAAVLAVACWGASPGSAVARAPDPPQTASRGIADTGDWHWPVKRFRLVAPYVQPADRYSAGHRGLDLEPMDGDPVRAPAAGVVAFVGTVVDRPLVTIDHGHGLVTTLEPVAASVATGASVARGAAVGELVSGGHASPGSVHFGVRYEGEYINPLVLLGGVPRAVLLPCCD